MEIAKNDKFSILKSDLGQNKKDKIAISKIEKTLLDIGCGDGFVFETFCNANIQYGVDASKGMLTRASEKFPNIKSMILLKLKDKNEFSLFINTLNSEEKTLNIANYQSGIYILRVNSQDGIQSYKFIKK